MSRICPHCNYARQAADVAPDWQCPSCERAYAKAAGQGPELASPDSPAMAPARSKWWLVVLAFGFAFWAASHLPRSSPPGAEAEVVGVAGVAGQPEVVLYATEWCAYCKRAREFFAANNIRYVEHDIEKSSVALDEHRRLGGNGVPLILVGDEVIKGYSEQALRQLLGPWIGG